MAAHDLRRGFSSPPSSDDIAYITCPQCQSPKAVVAATTYQELLCFCPSCEHVWDCPKPDSQSAT